MGSQAGRQVLPNTISGRSRSPSPDNPRLINMINDMMSKPAEIPRYDPNNFVKIPSNYVLPPPNKSQMSSNVMNKNYTSNHATPSPITPQNQPTLYYPPKPSSIQNQNYISSQSNISSQKPQGPQVVVPQIPQIPQAPQASYMQNNNLSNTSKPVPQNYQAPSSQSYRSNSPIYSNTSFQPNQNIIPANNQTINNMPNAQSIGKGLTSQMYNLSISQKPNSPPDPSSKIQSNQQFIPNSNVNTPMPNFQNQNKNSSIKPPPTIVTLSPPQPAKSNTIINPTSSFNNPIEKQAIKQNSISGQHQNFSQTFIPNLNQQNNANKPIIQNSQALINPNPLNPTNPPKNELINGGFILGNESFAGQNDSQVKSPNNVFQPEAKRINSTNANNITQTLPPASNQINSQISRPGILNFNSQSTMNPSFPLASTSIQNQPNSQFINRNIGNQAISNSYNPLYKDYTTPPLNSTNVSIIPNNIQTNNQFNNLKSDSKLIVPASNSNSSDSSDINRPNPVIPALQAYANKTNPNQNQNPQIQSNRTLQALTNQVNQSSYSSQPLEINFNQTNLYQQSLLNKQTPEIKIQIDDNTDSINNINKTRFPYSFENPSSKASILPNITENPSNNNAFNQFQAESNNTIQVSPATTHKEQEILYPSQVNDANNLNSPKNDKLDEANKTISNNQNNNFNPNLARHISEDIKTNQIPNEITESINELNNPPYEYKNNIIPEKFEENEFRLIDSNLSTKNIPNNINNRKEENKNFIQKRAQKNIPQKKQVLNEQVIEESENKKIKEDFKRMTNHLFKYPDSSNLIPLDPSWEKQIRKNVNNDPKNESLVIAYIIDMMDNPDKMSKFIDGVFAKLNIRRNELSPIEFKEFFDLTSSGMNAPILDSSYIMNQFNLIPKTVPNFLSKQEMQIYVVRLYKSIVNYAISCLNHPK